MIPIAIDDVDIVSFIVDSSGHLFLNVLILDECNLPALRIQENELVFRSDSWDVEFVGRTLTLREGPGNIALELEFCPPSRLRIAYGRLLCNGVELLLRRTHTFLVNSGNVFAKCSFSAPVGIGLGRTARGLPCAISVNPTILNRYEVPRAERLQEEQAQLKELNIEPNRPD